MTIFLSLALLACAESTSEPQRWSGDGSEADLAGAEVELSDRVPTVATVWWQTEAPVLSRVRFGPEGGPSLVTAWSAQASTDHEAVLVGVPELTDVVFDLELLEGDGTLVTLDGGLYTTGALDPAVPRPWAETIDPEAVAGGFTLVPVQDEITREHWATVLDAAGRLVWGLSVAGSSSRIRQAWDGSGLLVHDEGPTFDSFDLVHLSWTGEVEVLQTIPEGRQDFDLVDADTIVVLSDETRTVQFRDGPELVQGDRILEVDADGTTRELWNAFEDLDQDPADLDSMAFQLDDGLFDWTHANYLRVDPADDTVYTTLRHLDAVVAVDRVAGEPRWTLAERFGDYDRVDEGVGLLFPHSAQALPGGLLVFNQGDGGSLNCAEAVFLAVDEERGTFSPEWRYASESCFALNFLGNAELLEGGNLMVDFSQAGIIDEVDPDGLLVQRIEAPPDASFLYAERVPHLGLGRL